MTLYRRVYMFFSNIQEISIRDVEDGEVERSWTHLFIQTHQIYSYIWNNFLWKENWKLSNSYTSGEQEKAHNQEEMLRHNLTVNPTPGKATQQGNPEEWRVWTPQWACQLLRPAPERYATQISSSESQQGSYTQVPQGIANWEVVLKGLAHGLTYPRAQNRSSHLKSTKMFYERGLFAYHKLLAWGAGI